MHFITTPTYISIVHTTYLNCIKTTNWVYNLQTFLASYYTMYIPLGFNALTILVEYADLIYYRATAQFLMHFFCYRLKAVLLDHHPFNSLSRTSMA